MPFEMRAYVQSVLVERTVYVGGGRATSLFMSEEDHRVMAYDISSGQWTKLPPYRARDFAMTMISNQLVLVGGWEPGVGRSKVLGVWRAKWTHPYPDMPTAREGCSAVGYKEWLVMAGGRVGSGDRLSSVEVLNTDTKQWYIGPSTPVTWRDMKTAIVGDTCYFMGGLIGSEFSNKVYSVSLPVLVSQLNSSKDTQIWKEMSQLPIISAASLSISGSLLAVGGRNECMETSAILLYQPATGEWVKIGDLPSPRCSSACTMLTDKEFFVAGGYNGTFLAEVNFATIP